jgi:hypothetical protein
MIRHSFVTIRHISLAQGEVLSLFGRIDIRHLPLWFALRTAVLWRCGIALLRLSAIAAAFPPAPYDTLYGMVELHLSA